MFLRQVNRDRLIGLVAALAVLMTGMVATGAISLREAPSVQEPEGRPSSLECRSEIVC